MDQDEEIKRTGEVHLRKMESQLDTHTDPFAPREGKTLVWKNVNMILVRLLLTIQHSVFDAAN